MAEAVETAIKKALFARVASFAAANSLTVAWPSVNFTRPTAGQTVQWLRVTHLPAPSLALGIAFSANNQHYGLLQVDAFQGSGIGELAATRLASSIINYFARGTRMTSDGFTVEVSDVPTAPPLISDDPWVFIPVRVPYRCFATPA